MPPSAGDRASSIEPTPRYEEFINTLREFHTRRGTLKTFEAQPRCGQPAHRVDLLQLYERVTADGGYDQVSNTRTHKLYWRNVGQEFGLGDQNLPGLAFTLKTAYYRNLVAYEIVNLHKKVPPPKEILEEVSAKGGDVMSRSLDNFHRPMSRDGAFLNGNMPDGDEEDGTNAAGDEEAGIGRRLRQAPAQRQLFQSDMTFSRQTRAASGPHPSPTPGTQYSSTNGSYSSTSLPMMLANYEPRPPQPLTMRPVTTPSNNFEAFKAHQRQVRERTLAQLRKLPPRPHGNKTMPPGTGFPGPSIYYRALFSLQSGVIEEQEYALHHLVKISHERGDKYRFDSFQGLAEALLHKILEASELYLGTKWTISYDNDRANIGPDKLDGINGTTDLLKRIQNPRKRKLSDRIEEESFSRHINLINEAGLVTRNMVMLEENARYLAGLPAVRDTLILTLNLPDDPCLIELKQNALEITEQLSRFYAAHEDDALFQTLIRLLDSTDRAQITTALRSVCRLGSEVGFIVRLTSVPSRIVQQICSWMQADDEELRGACLDFLHQYTVMHENTSTLLESVDIDALVKQLTRLLLHNPHVSEREDASKAPPPTPSIPINEIPIPRIPQELVEQLLVHDEPDRSSQWLRACFEEDAAGEITQIALWQAYQIPFAPYAAQRPLLPAKDFITNVSNTFTLASAQVMHGIGGQRFVIKGIKARHAPVDPKGRTYMKCHWHVDVPVQQASAAQGQVPLETQPRQQPTQMKEQECDAFALWPKQMWEHIVSRHLGIPKNPDDGNKYDFTGAPSEKQFRCRWAGCRKFSKDGERATAIEVGMHVKTHLPDSSEASYRRGKHQRVDKSLDRAAVVSNSASTATAVKAESIDADGDTAMPDALSAAAADAATRDESKWTRTWQTQNTAIDERADATGLALMSVLVLRNLAKNLPGAAVPSSSSQGAAAAAAEAPPQNPSPLAQTHHHDHDHDHDHQLQHSSASTVAGAAPQASTRGGDEVEVEDATTTSTTTMAVAAAARGTPSAAGRRRRAASDTRRLLEANVVWRVFAPVKEQLYYVMAYNESLGKYVAELISRVEAVEQQAQQQEEQHQQHQQQR